MPFASACRLSQQEGPQFTGTFTEPRVANLRLLPDCVDIQISALKMFADSRYADIEKSADI